jgi:uncharacterized tellurite resistance protein B-like protein
MNWFESIIRVFAILAVGIASFEVYLKINKVWKRKHEMEVSRAQSLAGLTLALITLVVWLVYYGSKGDWMSMIDSGVYIVESCAFFLVGTGMFVKGNRGAGIWKLIRQSLRMERSEADYLLKQIFKPQNAAGIINILHQTAMIDEELAPREQKFISRFAREWGIKYSPDEMNRLRSKSKDANFIKLRDSIENYLAAEPPHEQAGQLKDLIAAIVQADEQVSEEEEIIIAEVTGLLESYINEDNGRNTFHVLIVPQREEHELMIKKIIPSALRMEVSGGVAYSVGEYYSRSFAEIICRQYRNNYLFTIVHSPNDYEVIGKAGGNTA